MHVHLEPLATNRPALRPLFFAHTLHAGLCLCPVSVSGFACRPSAWRCACAIFTRRPSVGSSLLGDRMHPVHQCHVSVIIHWDSGVVCSLHKRAGDCRRRGARHPSLTPACLSVVPRPLVRCCNNRRIRPRLHDAERWKGHWVTSSSRASVRRSKVASARTDRATGEAAVFRAGVARDVLVHVKGVIVRKGGHPASIDTHSAAPIPGLACAEALCVVILHAPTPHAARISPRS